MKGRFSYRSVPFGVAKAVLALVIMLLISFFYELLQFPAFLLGALIIIIPPNIPCSFDADDSGVHFTVGTKKFRLSYDEISQMNIKSHSVGYERGKGKIYENVLTILTTAGEFTLREDCGAIRDSDLQSSERLNNTELSRLEEHIREHI